MTKINPWDADFWGDNPREKFETIVNLAYISVGLSFLSLILHLIGHTWLMEFWYSDWHPEASYPYYLLKLLIGSDLLYWLDPDLTFYEIYSPYPIPTWYYFSVLSFPIVHGLFLIYFFKKDSAEHNLKIPLCLFFTVLVIKDLIFNFITFLDWSVDFGYLYIFEMLSEMVFKLFLLLFTLSIIIGIKLDASKFLPVVLSLVLIYLLVSFYGSLGLSSYYSLWMDMDVSSSYKLYVLLQFITLPLFWYSMTCLYIYRDTVESWKEQSTLHSTLKQSEAPGSTREWDEKKGYTKKTSTRNREEVETAPETEDSEAETKSSMGKLEKLIERRNAGAVTSEEFEVMKKEILERKSQYSKEPVGVQDETIPVMAIPTDSGDEMVGKEVKDSVVSKSKIGGGSSKMQELEKLAEMKEKGLIDDDEFKQMKKEILGK